MTETWIGSKDMWLGFIYLLVGGVGLFIARSYSFGSTGRMGPGYFPSVIAVLLIGFGVLSLLRALRRRGERVDGLNVKGIVLITGSIVAFGALLRPLGVVIAIAVTALVSAAASSRFHLGWRNLAVMAALVAFCVVVFVYGLGMPLPLIGSWFARAAHD
jgi:hypothetical protein